MPFIKGQTGNPKGRPKKAACLTEILQKELSKKDPDGICAKTKIAQTLIRMGIEGDVTALKYLFDRVDGRPSETVAVTSVIDEPNIDTIIEKMRRKLISVQGTNGEDPAAFT